MVLCFLMGILEKKVASIEKDLMHLVMYFARFSVVTNSYFLLMFMQIKTKIIGKTNEMTQLRHKLINNSKKLQNDYSLCYLYECYGAAIACKYNFTCLDDFSNKKIERSKIEILFDIGEMGNLLRKSFCTRNYADGKDRHAKSKFYKFLSVEFYFFMGECTVK